MQAKYSKPQICKLSDVEVRTGIFNVIKRIHIITGWPLPNDDEYLAILADELMLKLQADFYMMNFDEVVLAFRKNGIGVKDWGKNMNLTLVCEVLAEYCNERLRLSAEEERLKAVPPKQVIYTDEQLLNLHRQDIENFYQRCRAGIIPSGIPPYFLPVLIKDGWMADGSDDMTAFFSEQLNSNIQSLYKKQ